MLLALLVGVLPPSPAAAMFYQPQAEEAVSPPARSMQSTTRSKMDAGAAQAPTALPKAAGGSQAGGFTTQNIADFAATPISGRVFRDFNYDGLLTASGVVTDAGVSSVLVTAYNTSGAVGSATTDANGNYTISSSGNGPYRVEFSNLPADYEPTTVNTRFITTAADAVNVNLGINHPCDYCQNNPMVAQPIWMNGDPLVSGNLATGFWWKAFNYNNTGTEAVQHNITGSNIGALWGQAWQRSTKQLYASAAVRRHAGLGPLGLGGIYRFDFSSGIPAVSSFLDLDAAPFNIDFGTLPANGSGGRNLPNNKGTPSFDPDAFAALGKQGIGDIDITEDEKTLFVVNLHTRSLIALDVTAGATPTTHQSYNIIGAPGVPTCTNGELRPWALTFYRGSGYLGAVCDASSSSGTTNDLQAYILRFDPASPSAGYTTALSIPLNYTKGGASNAGVGIAGYGKEWNPWRDAWNSGPSYLHVGGTGANVLTGQSSIVIIRPTPILMDIEFDDNGDMAIALGDRMAMQTGSENAWPNDGITNLLIVGFVGGDLLKACHSHGANFAGTPTSGWTLESNGVCGGVTSVRNPSPLSYNTNPTSQGIGGREFYQDHSAIQGHEEALVGGLATWPGRKELIYSAYDTVYAGNGGIQYNRTTDGYLVRGYLTYPSGAGQYTGYMGKAVGVGDLEVLCDPAPLRIGNRVWDDLDGDGVQDPNEPGLSGLTVSLQGPTGTVTATTDANGQYIFPNLAPNTAYTLSMAVPSGYNVPPANATSLPGAPVTSNDPISDTRDSDATLVGSAAQIAYTTGGAGQNNYGLTFGFTTQTPAQFGDRVWVESDTDGLASTGVITPVAGMAITATSGSNVYVTTTDAQGYYSFTVPAGTYTVTYGSVPSSYGSVVASSTPGGNSESGNEGSYQQSGNPDQSHQNNTTVTVAAGEANWSVDFAFNLPSAPLAQFGDRVWVESDTDGLANTGVITPVAGMVITATSGSTVYTTTTNAQGYYSFTVPAGTYTVTYGSVPSSYGSVVPSSTPGGNSESGNEGSYQQSGNPDQSHQNNTTVTMAAGEANWSVDFAFNLPSAPLAQFGDRVWVESDTDGLANTGVITPVAGMAITATSGSTVYTTTTNAQGYYSFTVPAGTYTVVYGSVPSSYGSVVPSSTPGGNSESGNAGSYQQSGNPDQSHQNNTTVTVGPGQANWTIDFAFNLAGTPTPVNLGNYVWFDQDGDGQQDASEPGVGGVTVTLTLPNGNVLTTTTDASGYYTFTALTPNQTYTVTFFPPNGYTLTDADNGDDASDSDPGASGVVVVPMGSTDNYTIDAGLVPLVAQFGDRVWIESDTDGLASTGVITPVAGMLIIATNGSNVYATTTDAQGYYSFTVPAGSYTVLYGGVPSSYGNVVPSSTPGGNSESGNEGLYQEGGNPDQSHQNSTTVTVELGEANWTIDFAFHVAGIDPPSALPEEEEPEDFRFLYLPAVQMGVQAEGAGLSAETGRAEERVPGVFEAAPEAVPAVEVLNEGEAVEMQEIETAAP